MSVGFSSVVESVAWFNKSPHRRYRPGGDESSSSGEGQEQNDPPDDGLLLFVAISIDGTVTGSSALGSTCYNAQCVPPIHESSLCVRYEFIIIIITLHKYL